MENKVVVPFGDLRRIHDPIKKELDAAFNKVYETNAFIAGRFVEQFEQEFAKFAGTKHCVGFNSGTAALILALQALGVKAGDEVITVANTFIATTNAIAMVGATPVLVDINKDTLMMDVSQIEGKITKRTKAILPVHLFGQACDMDAIMAIAKKHNLLVLEDACQAHDTKYNGKSVGTFGNAAAFSFYPGKNLGCLGDGGAVTTNDDETALKLRDYRAYGERKKYHHVMIAGNERLHALQAALLSVKLPHLQTWNKQRGEAAEMYKQKLGSLVNEGLIKIPSVAPNSTHIYHLFIIQTPKRDGLQAYLTQQGIQTGIHYPVPIHLQEAYKHYNIKEGSFPHAEKAAKEILSLPMFPGMTNEQVTTVCDAITNFFKQN